MKILYFEDTPEKYWDVSNVLARIGLQAEQADNLQDGLRKWEEAMEDGEPYRVILTDMQFPLTPGGAVCDDAGDRVVARFCTQEGRVPVIVCSSMCYHIPAAHGCVWYSPLRTWQNDLLRLLQAIPADG